MTFAEHYHEIRKKLDQMQDLLSETEDLVKELKLFIPSDSRKDGESKPKSETERNL